MRLGREIDFTDDFRKRFMTKEYGNYEKYEKNSVKEEVDPGYNDGGQDLFWKNNVEMLRQLKSMEGK
jgi:hypothetical protein